MGRKLCSKVDWFNAPWLNAGAAESVNRSAVEAARHARFPQYMALLPSAVPFVPRGCQYREELAEVINNHHLCPDFMGRWPRPEQAKSNPTPGEIVMACCPASLREFTRWSSG